MSQMGFFVGGGPTPPSTAVETLTGNIGGPVPPTLNNINIVGDATTILVTGNPGTSTLTISNAGGLADSFPTDSGTATPVLGVLNIKGLAGRNISTSGAGNTVSIAISGTTNHSLQLGNATGSLTSLGVATNGQLPIGSVGADPVLSTLTAGTGITITNGAGSISIAASGSGVVQTITGNTGGAISPVAGNINIVTANSTPVFAGAGNTETLNFNLSNLVLGSSLPSLAGGLANVGVGSNVFSTLTTGLNNTAVGFAAATIMTTGHDNVAIGTQSLGLNQVGNSNTAIGERALFNLTGNGSNNTTLGYQTGTAYTTTESNNLILGYLATGVIGESNVTRIGGTQTSCYVKGVDGVNVGSTAKVVTMGTGGTVDQLGTAVITAGTGITVTPGANTITIAASGTGVISTITGNTGGPISPIAGNINIVTANATPKFVGAGNTETLDFGLSNLLLGSNGSITTGVANVSLGQNALSLATSGSFNTAIGWSSLNQFTSGAGTSGSNTTLGYQTLAVLTTGTRNTVIGAQAGAALLTGTNNILLGMAGSASSSGAAYTSSESSNIDIGNSGVITESNTLRIGTTGSGAGQQNRCFIAGIDGVNVGSVARVVTEASDQLGTAVLTAGAGITITPTANVITIAVTGSGTTTLTYTNVNTTPYVVLTTDEFLGVDTSALAITVQLPNAPATGRVFIIKDRTGNANVSNITVTTVGGAVNIDGATTFVMNTQYAAINILFDGATYQIF